MIVSARLHTSRRAACLLIVGSLDPAARGRVPGIGSVGAPETFIERSKSNARCLFSTKGDGVRDTEIIERVMAGEVHAYGMLVERYQVRAMTLALRLLKNRQDAEEALQDAFVRAYNGLPRFERKSAFSTWLYRILYNVCTSVLRRRGGQPSIVPDAFPEELHAAAAEHPDRLLEGAEFERIVAEEVNALPPVYAGVFTMFVSEEMTYDEIAIVMDVPLNTVKTRLFRARAALRSAVAARLAETSATMSTCSDKPKP